MAKLSESVELQWLNLLAVDMHVSDGSGILTFTREQANDGARYANISLGHLCVLDDVAYIVEGPNGQQYSNTVTRDNCQSPRLYCDRNSTQCVPTKVQGAACDADRECQSVRAFP